MVLELLTAAFSIWIDNDWENVRGPDAAHTSAAGDRGPVYRPSPSSGGSELRGLGSGKP